LLSVTTSWKWVAIARNEYRVHTGRIRSLRPFLPYVACGMIILHVLFIAPAIVSLFVREVISLILSHAAIATIQITMLVLFFYFMIMPITETLREADTTGRLEILLAAPIRPSDLLLGEYLGEMPFYAIIIAIFAGFFTAVLRPLEMSAVQIGVIVTIFVVISLSAFWIGIVVAATLRTKLERLASGRDIGRALAMLMPLPLVAVIYAAWGGRLFEALSNADGGGLAGTLLGLLPSSWGSGIIVRFASNPGQAVAGDILLGLGGLLLFFASALFFGCRIADRTYSLEQVSLSSSTVRTSGRLWHTVGKLGGGGSLGSITVALFKDFSRRLENLSNLVYILGILVLINFFVVRTGDSGDGAPTKLMTALFLYPILVVMASGGITVDGKEKLFLYRKAPFGVSRYLKAVFLRGLLLMLPITGVSTALIAFVGAGITPVSALLSTLLTLLIVAALVAFVMGLFLINPAFSDKSPRLWINVIIVMTVNICLFLLTIMILTGGGGLEDPRGGLLGVLLLHGGLVWGVGAVLLLLGRRRLRAME